LVYEDDCISDWGGKERKRGEERKGKRRKLNAETQSSQREEKVRRRGIPPLRDPARKNRAEEKTGSLRSE
jgi:hypothetical protein